MSTLADEFLNDINSSDEEDETTTTTTTTNTTSSNNVSPNSIKGLSGVVDGEGEDLDIGDQEDLMLTDEQIDKKQNELISNLKDAPIESVAKLKGSDKLNNILSRVNEHLELQLPNKGEKTAQGTTELQLIVECNAMIQDIQHEIYLIHKYVRERYSVRFPELDSTIQNPLDYINVVKRIGVHNDLTQVELSDLLPKASIMVLLVTFSSTTGKPISQSEINTIIHACDMALELDLDKKLILSYLESRMSFIAPNLSVLLGSSIAARLVGIAGGVQNLSIIPAGNLQTFGASKKHLEGFSGITSRRFQSGLISQCEIVKKAPPYLQKNAIRVLTGKVSICARVDAQQESSLYGETGRQYKDEVLAKIEKWQEPPPVKQIKALAAPDDRPRKKRGGRRARAYKQKYQITDLRAAKNRMAFGVEEKTSIEGEGMGMIGGATGKLRLLAQDRGILKKKKLEQKDYGSGQASGIQTVMITPVQGFQLAVGQQTNRLDVEKKERYFNTNKRKTTD